MYEKQFLKDVAVQNYTKYGINATDWWQTKYIGEMFVINRSQNINENDDDEDSDENDMNEKTIIDDKQMKLVSAAMFGKWFQKRFLSIDSNDKKHKQHTPSMLINQPILLENSLNKYDAIISMTKIIDNNIGIIGIDLYLNDLAEDVIYFNKYTNSYAFICDKNGITIMHPTYPRPLTLLKQLPHETLIIHLEQSQQFINLVYGKMLSESYGNVTINQKELFVTSYTWQHTSYNYIVCIVTKHSNNDVLSTISNYHHVHNHKYQKYHSAHHYYDTMDEIINNDRMVYEQQPYHDLVYHRMDLMLLSAAKLPMCQQFKRISSMGK